jgi:hypothetical protein
LENERREQQQENGRRRKKRYLAERLPATHIHIHKHMHTCDLLIADED